MKLYPFLLLLAIPAFAQQPITPPPAPGPQLSDLEKTKLENINLKFQRDENVKKSAADDEEQLRKDYAQLVADVAKAHPGFVLDTQGNLAPAPRPAQPAPAAKPTEPKAAEKK
jgi:hypothetical protein